MARPTLSKAFGLLLKERRKAAGISREALAYRAKVRRTYVGLVERGKRNASLHISLRLARALTIPLAKLIAEAERQI